VWLCSFSAVVVASTIMIAGLTRTDWDAAAVAAHMQALESHTGSVVAAGTTPPAANGRVSGSEAVSAAAMAVPEGEGEVDGEGGVEGAPVHVATDESVGVDS